MKHLSKVLHIINTDVYILRSSDQKEFNLRMDNTKTSIKYNGGIFIEQPDLNTDERVIQLKSIISGRWNETFVMSRLECYLGNINQTDNIL